MDDENEAVGPGPCHRADLAALDQVRIFETEAMSHFPGGRTLSRTLWKPWDVLQRGQCRLDRPIFIVGCPRSGTTLFVRTFGLHPELAEWSEAINIWESDPFDPKADHVRTEREATPEVRRRLAAIFSLYTWLCRADRFVNKFPRNALQIPYLQALFPDCFVIHVIRDGKAVVASLLQKVVDEPVRQGVLFGRYVRPPGWRDLLDRPLVEQFAHLWLRLVRHARAAGKQLPSRSYTEVSYEEFCREPLTVLHRLYDWCGLDAWPRLQEVVPEAFEPRNPKWRNALSPSDQERVTDILGPMLEELGYERS